MSIVGDASKARLIAVLIDHLIAFALMLFVEPSYRKAFQSSKASASFLFT
jgi:hypothetical protein